MSYPATLLDLLRAAAIDAPQHVIVHVRPDGTERVQAYGELRDEAERVSAGLRASGLEPGSPVIVLPERSEEFLPAFWGVLLAGLVPVPLARELDKLLAVAAFLDWPALIVDPEMAARLPTMQARADLLFARSLTIDMLLAAEPDGYRHESLPSDLAYLQFSSGSTGQPKGVELTHANVLANVEQIIAVTGAGTDDVSVSWMPYAHDMGLVCTHLVPLATRMKQVKIGPLHFVRRPAVWFEVAHRHQATILTAANFALMLVLKRVRPEQLAGLDLRAVRILANGSEPVSPRVCREFLNLLAPCGLQHAALLPVYGLAEACVGATFPPRGQEPVVHVVDREALVRDGRVVPADARSEVVEIADLGFPLPGVELRIMDDLDRPVEEGVVGQIQLRGPNVMRRYHRVVPGSDTFCADWLRTGDQGFLFGGRLSVTGRTKDVVVVSGRKHHAHDLEEVVRQVPGVRPETVAVCSMGHAGDERVIVFIGLESERGLAAAEVSENTVRVLKDVARAVQQVLGREVTHVLPLRPREFPRTTSGKIQRYKLRTQYDAGAWNDLARTVEAACSRYGQADRAAYGEPVDRHEAQVCAIWARVLGRRAADLNRHDDFRALGGTSLQAMEVLVELEALAGRSLEPAVLLERPTIADLADFLRREPGLADGPPTVSRFPRGSGRNSSAPRARYRRRATLKTTPDPIAVVGMACRFPGANSPEQFWANLAAGVDSVTTVPPGRWPVDQLFDQAPDSAEARSISRWGAFLDDVAGFDAAFFEIDPDEAAVMDPQQRILLEVAYEALERAGYAGERRAMKRVGVFVGVGENNYAEYLQRRLATGRPLHLSAAIGNLRNLGAARIARALSLTGPVMAVDTACSSALVALHLARQSILLGECDLAVVGAASLNLTATPYLLMSQAGALSPTGRCRAFDAAADGFVPGEGAGAIVLASLANVRHEGDSVIGLVRGTTINNDGRSISPMAPNPIGQQAVLAQAYRDARIDPASVSYIEAHGTGTPIGDPIEARSLGHTFPRLPHDALRPVGSVKTNIGHLLNASGMPGLIKVLLQLEHRQLAPSLHYHQDSHRFDLAAAGFKVPLVSGPWTGPVPLRAGINGFGFGGTNAHVILEESPARTGGVQREAGRAGMSVDRQSHLLTLSARSETALRETARALAAYVHEHPRTSIADLCFSASTARDGGEHRAAVMVQDDLNDVLEAIAAGRKRPNLYTATVRRGHRPRVVFLFSGQGAQYARQGQHLYETEPAFARALGNCAAEVGDVLGRPLLEWCYGADAADEGITRTAVAQPLLVAFEVALAQLLIGWGIRPDAVVGHSIGEVAAAAMAGALPVENALLLARERGRLMDRLPEGGAMAAVFASEASVRAAIAQADSGLAIAAINGPREVVVTGRTATLDDLLAALWREGIATKRLRVSHAFHSPLMEPVLESFGNSLQALASSPPRVPFFSTVRGDAVDGVKNRLDATYWLDHVTQPVLFAAAVERLLAEGYDTFVEIGPGSALCALVRRICVEQGKQAVVQPLLQHGEDDERSVGRVLGRLWTLGTPIDRIAMEGKRGRKRLALPTYPFQHVPYWVPDVDDLASPPASHKRSDAALFYEPVWENETLPSSHAANRPRRWLLVPDRIGVARHLRDMLRTAGDECEVVSTAELGARMTSDQPYGIVHLGGCGTVAEIQSVEALDHSQQQGVLDLLAAGQAIMEHPATAYPAGLWVVSSDACMTGAPGESPAPERATLAGLAQALPDECPGLRCRHIDLQSVEGPVTMAALVLRELHAGNPEQAPAGPIAWRGGRRLARTLRHAKAPEASVLRSNGIYLVTGGATGIGAELARAIARRGRSTLVLLGRTPLADAPARAQLVAELEAAGASAEYREVDVGEPAELEATIAHIIRVHGPITGVVHAAGVVDPGLLRAKTVDRFAAVLRPKVRGTWLLVDALRRHRQEPEFFVVCSSLASVMPGLGGGLADYVAANAFLDAMAAVERAAGRPVTSINWSVWAETGMGAQPVPLERMFARGFVPMGSDEAAGAFMRAIRSTAAQVVIADIEPAAEGVSRHPAAMPVEKANGKQRVPRSQPLTPVEDQDAAREDPIHRVLRQLVAGALHIDMTDVPIDESFMALGLDSLAAVELVKSLEHWTATPLPLTLFFEYTTIRELAGYLREHAPAVWHVGGAQAETAPASRRGDMTVVDDGSPFELTPVQHAFLVNHELYPDVAAFSFLRQTLRGPLSAALLLQALLVLEARHPMLRARIERPAFNGAPRQRILASDVSLAAWPSWFEVHDGAGEQPGATTAHWPNSPDEPINLDELIANRPFDLREEAPFRAVLVRESSDLAHLLLSLHHIVGDAWSLNILVEELWQVYTRLARGLPPDLPPLQSTFKAYAQGQAAASSERDLRWWKNTLAKYGARSEMRLPYDGDASAPPAGIRSAVQVRLDEPIARRLRERAASAGLSLFHLLLAGYVRCLARWSEQTVVAVNVAQAGRGARLPDIERLVGCFADTLPIEVEVRADEATPVLAQHVRNIWVDAQHHGQISTYDLARLLPSRGAGGPRTASPASFSFARFPLEFAADCPVAVEATAARTGSAATRLALLGWEVQDVLHFSWNFPTSLFRHATVERLAQDYLGELEHIAGVVEPEHHRSLACERIVAQCARTPDAVAVRSEDQVLTYHELDQRSSLLATRLRRHPVKIDCPVGLLALPGSESVTGILGIMKAGLPWLPLDPEHPPARLRRQIESTNVTIIVCQNATHAMAVSLAGATAGMEVFCLDACVDDIQVPADEPIVQPATIAYVIFTSGSTGTPKAVPITHAALDNYLEWMIDTFNYRPGDRVLQTASLCFDASVSQILAPLMAGATVVPVPKGFLRDPAALLLFVQEQRPTIWRSVPSLWERMLRVIERRQRAGHALPDLDLRWISVGGEALPASLVRRWMNLYGDRQRFSNHYGPTEATINATCYLVPGRPANDDEYIPIGRPVRGAKVLVCGEDGQPIEAGMAGELHIGGRGLSPGYLGEPSHADTRFYVSDDGQRWYRTGDLVRERSDGELVFLGRTDDQVKLQGYRIEPGEIEAALYRHPAIGQAAVVARSGGSGIAELVAYIEPRGIVPSDVELRRFLSRELPPYMIPHRFETVDALPTGATGKVDRRRLGAEHHETRTPHIARDLSRWTRTERLLADVWAEVLSTSPINREDDFFELGGDSLRALEVFARLEGSIATLPRAGSIFRHRTLSALASAIDAEQEPVASPPSPGVTTLAGMFSTTPAQSGFLLAAALAPDVPTNWCASIQIEGTLDLDIFTRAVQILVQRHPMLRVIFPAGVYPPRQLEIRPDGPLDVGYDDLVPLAGDPSAQQQRLDEQWRAERTHRFATDRWPLLRMRICRLDATQHVWFVTAHHVIADGLSAAIFGQELFQVYDCLVAGIEPALPPLCSTFRDYAELLEREHAVGGAAHARYWRDVFATPYTPPVAWRSPAGAEVPPGERTLMEQVELASATVAGLKRLAVNERVTPYVLLLTTFFRQLLRHTGTDDLLVGMAVSGRDHQLPGILRIFGCFATALPLRARIAAGEHLAQVQQIATLLAAAQEHQLAPQQIARLVPGGTQLASLIGAQFFFTYMDFDVPGPFASETLRVQWDVSRSAMDPPLGTDLLLAARPVDGRLRLTVQGAVGAFSPRSLREFIEELAADLRELASLGAQMEERPGASAPPSRVRFVHDDVQGPDRPPLDAALVGYLPPWQEIAPHIGRRADTPALRNQLRAVLFRDGQPRIIEESATRLGRSGFICVPWFADELAPAMADHLVADISAAVRLGADVGARCVSLAGMLPSLTGYGFNVLRQAGTADAPSITTGHGLTVVSVVMAIEAALHAVGRRIAELDLAFVGLGSIGRAALELLLWRGSHPRSITLCDMPGRAAQLGELELHIRRSSGYAGQVRRLEAEGAVGNVPEPLYVAGLIVGATSRPRVLDVDRLRPGTIVVDDSYPHCFDVGNAIARMRRAADVLLIGGGLLDCKGVERTIYVPPGTAAIQERIAQRLPYQAMASCQLESLLRATNSTLPLIHGLVDLAGAQCYWTAATTAGIGAGPLHLQDFVPDEQLLDNLRRLHRQ